MSAPRMNGGRNTSPSPPCPPVPGFVPPLPCPPVAKPPPPPEENAPPEEGMPPVAGAPPVLGALPPEAVPSPPPPVGAASEQPRARRSQGRESHAELPVGRGADRMERESPETGRLDRGSRRKGAK